MSVRGEPVGQDYRHPRWSDGTPILIDQEVTHVDDGWAGFVCGVPSSDEVLVQPYGEGDVDAFVSDRQSTHFFGDDCPGGHYDDGHVCVAVNGFCQLCGQPAEVSS